MLRRLAFSDSDSVLSSTILVYVTLELSPWIVWIELGIHFRTSFTAHRLLYLFISLHVANTETIVTPQGAFNCSYTQSASAIQRQRLTYHRPISPSRSPRLLCTNWFRPRYIGDHPASIWFWYSSCLLVDVTVLQNATACLITGARKWVSGRWSASSPVCPLNYSAVCSTYKDTAWRP